MAKIDYSGQRTKIWLANGTLVPKEYDFVVVTSALGHLKLYARQMFNPPLPRKKLEQIDKIGSIFLEEIINFQAWVEA